MDWVNLLLFAALTAGHTEVLVTLVNRVHGRPVHARLLKQVRHLHDFLILAFPVVLVLFLGIGGPGLLTGGSWGDLPLGWMIYLAVCGLGAGGLVCSSIVRRLRPVPTAQLSNHSQVVDVASRLGYRPIGNGPFRSLVGIPGNQVFQVEVNEKTYRLPRLPAELDGLSILHLSDLHFIGTLDRPFFEQVIDLASEMPADLVVFTGDLLDDPRLIEWLPATLGRLQAPLGCHFILGNHDWDLNPGEIRRGLSDLGWNDVSGASTLLEKDGTSLVVAGTERPWMGVHPDLANVPDGAFRILLSHTPDNLPWAKQQGIDLMLSGHNHGGQVVLPLIGPVYSPSIYGTRYAGGVFWDEPTLLYVSRGVSGRHPLRLNCMPEVTKLVLRSGRVSEAAVQQELREESAGIAVDAETGC
jgi:uncharacterized protein